MTNKPLDVKKVNKLCDNTVKTHYVNRSDFFSLVDFIDQRVGIGELNRQ